MVKLPARTTANASFSMGANHQDEALIPWTTNTSITTPATYAAFPGLAALPRESAQMRVNYTTGTANVTSRAIKNLTLTARYRFNSRSDFTRPFDAIEYVRFDAVPEETGGVDRAVQHQPQHARRQRGVHGPPVRHPPRRLRLRPVRARRPDDPGLEGQHGPDLVRPRRRRSG